jgi:hypothetical protein
MQEPPLRPYASLSCFAHEVPALGVLPFGNDLHSVELRVLIFGIPIAALLYSLVVYETHFKQRIWIRSNRKLY